MLAVSPAVVSIYIYTCSLKVHIQLTVTVRGTQYMYIEMKWTSVWVCLMCVQTTACWEECDQCRNRIIIVMHAILYT